MEKKDKSTKDINKNLTVNPVKDETVLQKGIGIMAQMEQVDINTDIPTMPPPTDEIKFYGRFPGMHNVAHNPNLSSNSTEKSDFEGIIIWAKSPEFIPFQATPNSAGYDVMFDIEAFDMSLAKNCYRRGSCIIIGPGGRGLFPCGFRIILRESMEAQIRPRSGRALIEGLGMVNSVGTIDSDYRGVVGCILMNYSDGDIIICDKEKIGQMILAPFMVASSFKILELSAFMEDSPSDRGEGGFGHTGNTNE